MLSTDPYNLSHIRNADFVDGAEGWDLAPAEPESIKATALPNYGRLQGRSGGMVGTAMVGTKVGDTFLWTRRSHKAPNRFSQTIRNLEPGRHYSLKMHVADYQHMLNGISNKHKHQVQIRIDNVLMLPDKSFQEVLGSCTVGGAQTKGKFSNENNAWVSFFHVFFQAKAEEALLTISDWKTDKAPGGPIGQELMFNYIEVQPGIRD